MSSDYDGLVLAGGRSRRMGVPAKPALAVAGRPMLRAALDALVNASRVVVVGPGGDVCEDPPHGGPVAAIAAGLALVQAPVVAVLAADLPFVTVDAVTALVEQASSVAVDDHGRAQYLLAAFRTDELRSALPDEPAGRPLREVVDRLSPRQVALPGQPPPWWDCDTPQALARARSWSVTLEE